MSETTNTTTIPAGTWTLDTAHSSVSFSVRHMMVSKVRGRFSEYTADIVTAEDPLQSKVNATIQVASIDTGQEMRDNHLRSADFFDAASFPSIEFVSNRIEPDGDDYLIHGDLTIRGVTRPVVLTAEYAGTVPNMKGGLSAGFSARTKINREDFGLTWNVALESGGVMVGKDVRIAIDLEVVSAEQSEKVRADVA